MIEWIPVSERLPEEGGEYLVSYCMRFFENYCVDIFSYDHEIGFYDYDSEYGDIPMEGATAWAPLPEPYRGIEQ